MNQEFIPYDQAVALKQLGFDKPCFAVYEDKKWQLGEVKNSMSYELCLKTDTFPTPTFSQAFRWFRENHNLWSMVYPREGWNYSIQGIDETATCTKESFHSIEINTYKESELACLIKLIEIVKEKR